MVDQHDIDIVVNKQAFIKFLHQNTNQHVQIGDTSTMIVKEWAEPTQQSNLATKATLTDTNDKAEKATARQNIKGISFRINAERSTDSVASKSQKGF